MSYDQEKMKAFEDAVRTETDQKIALIQKELSEHEQEEIAKAREQEYDKMFTYMQDQVRAIKAKHKQRITKFELEYKRSLLLFRNKLSEQVFKQAKAELLAFAESSGYEAFLIQMLQTETEGFPCENAVVYVRSADLKYAKQIKQALPAIADVKADEKNSMGGFYIVNEEKGLLIDDTFAARLDEQRQSFYADCGLTVTI